MSQSWRGATMAPRRSPSHAIGAWEKSQDLPSSEEPLTDLHSHCRNSDGSVRESGIWTDRSRMGSRKASLLSRWLSEKGQQHSDSGSSSFRHSSGLDFPHLENSPSLLPSAIGHRTSMVTKDKQTDHGIITRDVPLWPFLAFPFILPGMYLSVLRGREEKGGQFMRVNSFNAFS